MFIDEPPSISSPLGDRSSPEDISAYFRGVSKADFRKAVGSLYKDRVLVPHDHEIKLIQQEDRQFKTATISSDKIKTATTSADKIGSRSTMPERDGKYKVFVGNLPVSINEKILSDAVEKLLGKGKAVSIRLPLNPNKQSRGFAFISFDSQEHQMEAVSSLKGFQLMGRALRTDIADAPRPLPAETGNQVASAPSIPQGDEDEELSIEDLMNFAPEDVHRSRGREVNDDPAGAEPPSFHQRRRVAATLYVGNLAYGVDERTLTQAVERVTSRGAVVECRIATDRETGRRRGFGYVDLASREDARRVMETMDGTLLMGRAVKVDDATRSRE